VSSLSVGFFNDPGFFSPLSSPANDTTGSTVVFAKVTKASTGCSVLDSIPITIHPTPDIQPEPMFGFTCNCIDVVSLINPFSTIPPGSDTTYFSDEFCTIPHPNPHLICSADTVYMIVKTNTNPSCADTAAAVLDLSPGSFLIANQTNANTSSCNSIPIVNNFISDGASQLFYNPIDCKKIATVTDPLNGLSLGTTSAEETIDCSVPIYNGQPYINRVYHITPATQDSATVCLYYLQNDILEYNTMAQSMLYPEIDPFTLDSLTISETHNGDFNTVGHTVTVIPSNAISKTFDANNDIWTVCFTVDSFSYFYAHAPNPLNAALPVTLASFTAMKDHNSSLIQWTTASELHNDYFEVERSRNGKEFYAVSQPILSKGEHGNSSTVLDYSFIDNYPQSGHNYYRLKQVDLDGKIVYSQAVDVYFGDNTPVRVYPNPATDLLQVEIQTTRNMDVQVFVTDATGRQVLNNQTLLYSGSNTLQIPLFSLQSGVYFVHVKNKQGLNVVQEFSKQ
jgi:hypothetical protein